jgi:hypothetical protein
MTNQGSLNYQPEPERYTQHWAIGVAIFSFFIAAAISPFTGIGVALYFLHRYVDQDRLAAAREEQKRLADEAHQRHLEVIRQSLGSLPSDGRAIAIPRHLSYHDGSLAVFIEAMEVYEKQGKAVEPSKQEPQVQMEQKTKVGSAVQGGNAEPSKVSSPASPPDRKVENRPQINSIAPSTQQTDLALRMAQAMSSRIICAAPRTGKGLLIRTALGYVQQLRPDVDLWALDIKADPGEDGYYDIFAPGRLLRVNLMGFDKPKDADAVIQRFFHAFNQSTALTKLIWVNEVVSLSAKLAPSLWKLIQQFAIGLCSAGSTGNDGQTGRFIWFDTQSPNVADFGLRTNASRNVFRRIFLMNADRSLLSSAVSSGFALGIDDYELLDFRSTGAQVVGFDSMSGAWVALPLYEPPISGKREESTEAPGEAIALPDSDVPPNQPQAKRPKLTKSELHLTAGMLAEWIESTGITEASQVYEKWQSRKHGFTRPEIRYLLAMIEDEE